MGKIGKMTNEYDTYYTSLEDISSPVGDSYYEFFSGKQRTARELRERQPPPTPAPDRKFVVAKFAAVGIAVAIIFFLLGFLSRMMTANTEYEPQHGKPSCPAGWELFQSKCYKQYALAHNYSQAETQCRKVGASLASITDRGINIFLRGLTADWKSGFWTGGHKVGGEWLWADGSPFLFNNWAEGEPTGVDKENCLEVQTGNGQWKSYACDINSYYICDKTADNE